MNEVQKNFNKQMNQSLKELKSKDSFFIKCKLYFIKKPDSIN